jgi:hypothetical protein
MRTALPKTNEPAYATGTGDNQNGGEPLVTMRMSVDIQYVNNYAAIIKITKVKYSLQCLKIKLLYRSQQMRLCSAGLNGFGSSSDNFKLVPVCIA